MGAQTLGQRLTEPCGGIRHGDNFPGMKPLSATSRQQSPAALQRLGRRLPARLKRYGLSRTFDGTQSDSIVLGSDQG
jgi:hypothetical protein